ncbi:MAG: alpha/beta hydrolase [Rhodocyclaceae bacterium]
MPLALRHTDIRIQTERVWLDALQSHAPDVRGLIVIAAPTIGRLRESRENYVAAHMRQAHYGTLIISMLTPYEEHRDPDVKFDIALLHRRLEAIFEWVDQQPQWSGRPLGLMVTGTVASAAVRLLAREPQRAAALVARSARADLAGAEPLRRLRVPTLMLVPGTEQDLRNNCEQAFALLGTEKSWAEFDGASAGFIEPGVLDAASTAAREWFITHLPPPLPEAPPEAPSEQ